MSFLYVAVGLNIKSVKQSLIQEMIRSSFDRIKTSCDQPETSLRWWTDLLMFKTFWSMRLSCPSLNQFFFIRDQTCQSGRKICFQKDGEWFKDLQIKVFRLTFDGLLNNESAVFVFQRWLSGHWIPSSDDSADLF